MVDGTDMEVPLYVLLLQAPALYRAMLKPSPGTLLELKVVLSRLKRMSARSSRFPKAFAHQAKDTPQPSQVPQLELALMVHVSSAAAKPLKAAASRSPLCMVMDRVKDSPWPVYTRIRLYKHFVVLYQSWSGILGKPAPSPLSGGKRLSA